MPNRLANKIRQRATLVLEPSSIAIREVFSGRVRKNSRTLMTGPRQAMHAFETTGIEHHRGMTSYFHFWSIQIEACRGDETVQSKE